MADSLLTYIVRHGEYDKGSGDLNNEGKTFIRLNARIIESELIREGIMNSEIKIYSSPKIRTIESAELIAGKLGKGIDGILIKQYLASQNWSGSTEKAEQMKQELDNLNEQVKGVIIVTHYELTRKIPELLSGQNYFTLPKGGFHKLIYTAERND